MHCSQVTELLSEYVDDVLDPTARAGMDEHLADCPACTAELAALRSYLEAMGSLPQVQAPGDFLAGVHERLEQPRWFKRLQRWLFFPMKVKLPFEAAGLVAASLLVVLLYRGTESEKAQLSPVFSAPSSSAPTVPATPDPAAPASPEPIPSSPSYPSAGKSLEGSRPLSASRLALEESKKDKASAISRSPSQPSAQAVQVDESAKAAPIPLQEHVETPHASCLTPHLQPPVAPKPMELVLHLKPVADLETAPQIVSREQPKAGASPSTSAPQAEEQILARKVAPAPTRATGKTASAEPSTPATILSQITELVEQAKGTILSVDTQKDTRSPQVVAAQIATRSYDSFVAQLDRLGHLERPAARPTIPDQDAIIQLRIRLIIPR